MKPLEKRIIKLPVNEQTYPGEYGVLVSFHLKEDTLWAKAGHEVAHGQYVYEVPETIKEQSEPIEVVVSNFNIGVKGRDFHAIFLKGQRGLISYRFWERK